MNTGSYAMIASTGHCHAFVGIVMGDKRKTGSYDMIASTGYCHAFVIFVMVDKENTTGLDTIVTITGHCCAFMFSFAFQLEISKSSVLGINTEETIEHYQGIIAQNKVILQAFSNTR